MPYRFRNLKDDYHHSATFIVPCRYAHFPFALSKGLRAAVMRNVLAALAWAMGSSTRISGERGEAEDRGPAAVVRVLPYPSIEAMCSAVSVA